jgi:hypothetical protein
MLFIIHRSTVRTGTVKYKRNLGFMLTILHRLLGHICVVEYVCCFGLVLTILHRLLGHICVVEYVCCFGLVLTVLYSVGGLVYGIDLSQIISMVIYSGRARRLIRCDQPNIGCVLYALGERQLRWYDIADDLSQVYFVSRCRGISKWIGVHVTPHDQREIGLVTYARIK